MSYYSNRVQFGFGGSLTPVVKNLLIINVAVYLVQIFTAKMGAIPPLIYAFALRPFEVTHHFGIWRLVTYMFLHGSFLHIFFNMFTLWMFGCEVERALGSKYFLKYYFMTGIGAGLFHVLFNWGSPYNVIGASGAIYGVLVAFAVLFPHRTITLLLFFVLPVRMKAWHLVTIFVGLSLISGIQGQVFGVSDGVAHLAHLGGALIGYLLLRGNFLVSRLVHELRIRQEMKRISMQRKKEEDIQRKREEVDRILDKINEVGYENISEKEKKVLKEFSEFLSREESSEKVR